MTVENTKNIISHTGNGSVTVFPYDFIVIAAEHMQVYVGGVLLGAGYTISNLKDPNGGDVTFDVAPANGADVVFRRVVPLTQLTDYQAFDAFPAQTHEDALDLLTMICQQLSADTEKSIKVPADDTATNLITPDALARAGTALGFDAAGNVITLALDTGVGIAQLQEAKTNVVAGQTQYTIAAEPKVVILDGRMLSKSAGEWSYNLTTKILTLAEAPIDGDQVLVTWNALVDLGGSNSQYVDIRDYGAVALDPNFDNEPAIRAAMLDAEATQSTVVIYGGPYYTSTFQMDIKTRMVGGILAPMVGASEFAPLFRITVDECQIINLTIDSVGTPTHGIQVNGNNNLIENLTARNCTGNPNIGGAASAVHLIGDQNVVDGLTVYDYLNGTATNVTQPRMLSVSSGASSNVMTNIRGFNVNAGLVHSDGSHNVLKNFKFDNSGAGTEEMINGIYTFGDSYGFTAQAGVIDTCAQPIVDLATDSTYKDIVEIDSFSDGIQFPCKNVTFDGIVKFWNDKTQDNGGFLRTRSGNSGQIVDGVTIQNCDIDLPTFYASFLVFDAGTVNNLIVKNNNVKTRHSVDGEAARDIVIHTTGENVRYSGNTFTVRNDVTPFTETEFFIISLPRQTTKGYWKNNEMYSPDDNVVVRAIGILDQESFRVEDTNQVRADIGKSWIQSSVGARVLTAIAPPNSGAWRAGDSLQNALVELNPPAGQEYRKFLFFVCIKSGNFADANPANHPEFKNYVDLTSGTVIGQITQPSIVSPAENFQFTGSTLAISSSAFSATAGVTHASTDWQVATDAGFSNIVFQSLADAVNLTSITATGLPTSSVMYIRVRYIGNSGETSLYSETRTVESTTTPAVDDSVGEVSTFTLHNTGRALNLQEVFVSTDKSLVIAAHAAGSDKLRRSTDKVNFSAITDPTNATYAIDDIDGADNGSVVFIAGASGLYRSTNPTAGTVSWSLVGGVDYFGLTDLSTNVACDATGQDVLLLVGERFSNPSVGARDIWVSEDGGVSSTKKLDVSGSDGNFECAHVAKNNGDIMFVGTDGTTTAAGLIFRSTDKFDTFSSIALAGLQVAGKVFCIDSTPDGQVVYAGCSNGRIYKSTDAGINFSQIAIGLTTESVRSCAVSRDGDMVAFGLQNGDYIRSFDGGNTFGISNLSNDKILSLDINSADNLMYAGGVSGEIQKSEL